MDIGRIICAILNGLTAAFVVWLLLWLVSVIGAPVTIHPWPTVAGVLVFLLSLVNGWGFPPRR